MQFLASYRLAVLFSAYTDPSGFILFPLVVHSFDLVISSVGIFSIRSTREAGMAVEDPMRVLQKGYSITIVLAVITFGVVRAIFDFSTGLLYLLVIFESIVSHYFTSALYSLTLGIVWD